jgi:parvulin-like peptidyl-prolyl isomerase
MRNATLIRATIRSLQKEFRPSEEEIKTEYKNNKDSCHTGDKVTAPHIMVSSQKEANDLIVKLKEDGNFAELAKELSVALEREGGGSLGTMERGQFRTTGLPEVIEQAAFSLDKGTYSKAVQSNYGWHVVYTKEKIMGKQLAFSEARASIEEKLGSDKFGKGIGNLLTKLRETYPVKIYPEYIR